MIFDLIFCRFPLQTEGELRQQWLDAINKVQPLKMSCNVCINHFKKSQVIIRKNSFFLTCGAVPSIFESNFQEPVARAKHREQQEHPELNEENSFDLTCGEDSSNFESNSTEPVDHNKRHELTETNEKNDPKYHELNGTIARLKQDLLELRLSSDLRHQNMQQSIISMKNKLLTKSNVLEESKKKLKKSLAENARLQNEIAEMKRRLLSASNASSVIIINYSFNFSFSDKISELVNNHSVFVFYTGRRNSRYSQLHAIWYKSKGRLSRMCSLVLFIP